MIDTKLNYIEQLLAYCRMTLKINDIYRKGESMSNEEWQEIVSQMFEDCDNAGFEYKVKA